jgi:hypothetical protein
MKSRQKPFEVYLLIITVLIQSSAAIFGGINLIYDPTGISIRLPISLLKGTYFSDFLLPGILLFVLIGLIPLFLIIPLILKPKWHGFNQLNIYKGYHWVWTYTLYNSIILISWINIQLVVLNNGSMIHGIVGILGTIMLILTLLPSVKSYYRNRSGRKLPEIMQN